ncbi:MAG: tetratricopeptide repeat protein [Desulfovibrionaceae bacterium]|nr:tetratricopeptide repeat protein [Desulfovibrionaceae bacterium]
MSRKLICLTAFLVLALAGCSARTGAVAGLDADRDDPGATAAQHAARAEALIRQGNPELAFVQYNKAILKDPDNPDLRVAKGALLLSRNLDDMALREFRQVLETHPDHALANECAGAVYFRSGLAKEARAHLLRALESDPGLWKTHDLLGILHNQHGEYDQAVSEFKTALSLNPAPNPGHAETLNNLGLSHIMRGEYQTAAEVLHQAVRAGQGDSKTYNNLGLALFRIGRHEEALEAFRYGGDEAKAYNNLGYLFLVQGQAGKDVTCFEKAIELSPAYYSKAFENLKRARLAAQFRQAGLTGDTPKAAPPAVSPPSPRPSATQGDPPVPVRPANSPPKAQEPARYGVHVSSWQDPKDARRHCRTLSEKGFVAHIRRVDLAAKGVWFRVLVGEYRDTAKARDDRPRVIQTLGLERAMICALPGADQPWDDREKAI